MPQTNKTLVQCDFDGTITQEDVSFMLLDEFAVGNWRQPLSEYEAGRITVGRFNREAFAMVKADRESLLKVAMSRVRIRPGFNELIACCRRMGFRLVIVSNGLDFYIKEILHHLGAGDIEFFAAETQFHSDGLKVRYVGPDGRTLDNDFKDAYVTSFVRQGYRVVYIGNGTSDLSPARRCHCIFATDSLLSRCRQLNLDCVPFTDFNQVVDRLERCG